MLSCMVFSAPMSTTTSFFLGGIVLVSFISISRAGLFGNYRCEHTNENGVVTIVESGDFDQRFAPFLTPDQDLSSVQNCAGPNLAIRRLRNNLRCEWHYTAPLGSYVYIEFPTFRLDDDCVGDFVRIESTGATANGYLPSFNQRYCRQKNNFELWEAIASNAVKITLQTDGQYACRGLAGLFFAFNPQVLTFKRALDSFGPGTEPTDCYSNETRDAQPGDGWLSDNFRSLLYPHRQSRWKGLEREICLLGAGAPQVARCNPDRQGLWIRQQLATSLEVHRLRQRLEQFEIVDSCTIQRALCSNNTSCIGCKTRVTTCPEVTESPPTQQPGLVNPDLCRPLIEHERVRNRVRRQTEESDLQAALPAACHCRVR